MQSPRTSPTQSPPSSSPDTYAWLPLPLHVSYECSISSCGYVSTSAEEALLHTDLGQGHRINVYRTTPPAPVWECGSSCGFRVSSAGEQARHHMATTGHTMGKPSLPEPLSCRCGRILQVQAVYICDGCTKPAEFCECTVAGAQRAELVQQNPEQPTASSFATLPEVPSEHQHPNLGDELETLAALLGQLVTQAKRTVVAGAHNLGPCHTQSGLESLIERLLGSAELHAKHLANKRRELSENRGKIADYLRDLAQKATIHGSTSDARELAFLAQELPKQIPEAVPHV